MDLGTSIKFSKGVPESGGLKHCTLRPVQRHVAIQAPPWAPCAPWRDVVARWLWPKQCIFPLRRANSPCWGTFQCRPRLPRLELASGRLHWATGRGRTCLSAPRSVVKTYLSWVWVSRPLRGFTAFAVTKLLCNFEPASLLLCAQHLQDRWLSNTAHNGTASPVCCEVTKGWRGPVGQSLVLLVLSSSALLWKTSVQRSREPGPVTLPMAWACGSPSPSLVLC